MEHLKVYLLKQGCKIKSENSQLTMGPPPTTTGPHSYRQLFMKVIIEILADGKGLNHNDKESYVLWINNDTFTHYLKGPLCIRTAHQGVLE